MSLATEPNPSGLRRPSFGDHVVVLALWDWGKPIEYRPVAVVGVGVLGFTWTYQPSGRLGWTSWADEGVEWRWPRAEEGGAR